MLAVTGIAGAQVKVGVIVSATGPAASLGIPEKNTVGLCSKSMGGKTVEFILLDEASDTTTAVQNAKKVIGEDKVDAIIGTTTTPTTLAILDVIADGETPTISLASSIRIIEPMDAKRAWMFKTPQTDVMMAGAILEHMAKNGVKTIGYVGFNDALGEAFFAEIDKAAKARNITLAANERFAPKDTSVVGQSLKLLAAKPDAIVIGASGTPAALPARTLGRAGLQGQALLQSRRGQQRLPPRRRQGHRRRLRADESGDRRGTVARQPSGEEAGVGLHQGLRSGVRCRQRVGVRLLYVGRVPRTRRRDSRRRSRSRNPAPRNSGARCAMLWRRRRTLPVTNGVVNMGKTDHLGLDSRARVMVQIKDGKWVLQN